MNLEYENILNFDCETFLNLEGGAFLKLECEALMDLDCGTFLNLECGTFLRNIGKNLGLWENSLIEEKAIGVSLSLNISYNKTNASVETTKIYISKPGAFSR